MIDVIVVGEGQTEETFVREALASHLIDRDINLQSRLIDTSQSGKGGSLAPDRVLRFLRNTLRERGDTYVTTFFDLYGLRAGFPGLDAARAENDPLKQCRVIEKALADAAIQLSGSRTDRFFAHIQPYEFEALLFSDVSTFATIQADWRRYLSDLQITRDSVETPEHINDGPTTSFCAADSPA